jgi:hypothetical protein
MDKMKIYAVLTGDVAGSSRLEGEQRQKLLTVLKDSFSLVDEIIGKEKVAFPFEIFRGDSFQGVLNEPASALRAAIIIRANIRRSFDTTLKNAFDARIAVGVGSISLLPDQRGGEGDGPAYRNSGPVLDEMTKPPRFLLVRTPWPEMNSELNVELALLDAIMIKWSVEQAEVALEFFKGKTQEQMAEFFQVSQPAIRKRLFNSNLEQITLLKNRFGFLLAKYEKEEEIIAPQGYI